MCLGPLLSVAQDPTLPRWWRRLRSLLLPQAVVVGLQPALLEEVWGILQDAFGGGLLVVQAVVGVFLKARAPQDLDPLGTFEGVPVAPTNLATSSGRGSPAG
jgi:hypothetical protein